MPNVKFRQDNVRTLAYLGDGDSQCVYWDEALRGFGVRVYGSGLRTYVCAYRVQRRKRLAKLGRVDVLTLDEARKKAKNYLGQAAGDTDPKARSDAQRATSMIKDLVDSYVEQHAKKKKITWATDESTLRRNLLPKLGTRLITTLTSADIEPIHARIGTAHPYAANTFLEVVRKMFNWGRTAGFVAKTYPNPVTGIVRFAAFKRKRFVTTVEMPRLLAAIDTDDHEFARHAMWLLLLTGVRVNELLKAKWADIDWNFRTLFVGLTKNGEPVLVPLSDAALDRLGKIPRLENNLHIICGSAPGKRLGSLRSMWLRVRAAAGMKDLRLHDLRRTVGSWIVQSGSSLHLVGAVLNHKDTKTTAGYAYFQTQQREDALTEHGRKVLKFAPPGRERDPSTPAFYEVTPTSTLPPNMPDLPVRRAHYMEREVLYRLVWEAPVSEVAARFGITDVGLAKACRRADIPVPGRGYWAKVESGVHLLPRPLPPAPSGLPAKIRLKGRRAPVAAAETSASAKAPTAQSVAA